MARANLGHGRCRVASVPPPPPVQLEAEEPDAQASEPTGAGPEMRAKIDPFASTSSSSQGYCPPPTVMAVHPEPVSIAAGM